MTLPARRIAERGARKLAAEQRALANQLRMTADKDDEAILLAERRANLFAEVAAEFKAGGAFLPGLHAHECALRRGQGL